MPVADFAAWIETEPNNPRAYEWLGNSYIDKGEFDRAIAAFTREIGARSRQRRSLALAQQGAWQKP